MIAQNYNHIVSDLDTTPVAIPILPAVIEQTAQLVFAGFSETLKATLNGRKERALKLALEGHVTFQEVRTFAVRSENGDEVYCVNLDKSSCTCPDSQKGQVCKHRLAAYILEQAMKTTQDIVSSPIQQPLSIKPLNINETALDKAVIALQARAQLSREVMVYAWIEVEGQPVQVELLNLEKDTALVRALPKVVEGRLIPHFPFPGKKTCDQVPVSGLTQVRIYRQVNP